MYALWLFSWAMLRTPGPRVLKLEMLGGKGFAIAGLAARAIPLDDIPTLGHEVLNGTME